MATNPGNLRKPAWIKAPALREPPLRKRSIAHPQMNAHVTIATELNGRAGVLGALERWFVARLLRPVYVEELALLAKVARAQAV